MLWGSVVRSSIVVLLLLFPFGDGSQSVFWAGPQVLHASVEVAFIDCGEYLERIAASAQGEDTSRLDHAPFFREYVDEWYNRVNRAGTKPGRLPTTGPLYRWLFSGLNFKYGTRLIITVDSWMSNLPFEVLRMDGVREPPRYMGLEHPITVRLAQIAAGLKEVRTRRCLYPLNVLALAPLAMSDPVRWEVTAVSSATRPRSSLGRLPLYYSRDELKGLTALVPTTSLLGKKARLNRSFLRQGYSVLHLATHARVDSSDGYCSSLLIAESGRLYPLPAAEIKNYPIQLPLVYLSACASGSSQSSAEGYYGVHTAFLEAGTERVVATRWPIDDRVAAELASYFYQHLRAGTGGARALWLARLDYWLVNQGTVYGKEIYWGGFACFQAGDR